MNDASETINNFHESLRKSEAKKRAVIESKQQAAANLKSAIQSLSSLVSVSGERVFTSVLAEHVKTLTDSYEIYLNKAEDE